MIRILLKREGDISIITVRVLPKSRYNTDISTSKIVFYQ